MKNISKVNIRFQFVAIFCGFLSYSLIACAVDDLRENAGLSSKVQNLEAQINKMQADYLQRPRKKFVGVTMESRFGLYVEDCLKKILEVSQSNYPEQIKGSYGQVQLTIEIWSDGTVHGLKINKSSGKNALDEAVINFVKIASPFKLFPEDIHKDTDILFVTRTFIFTTSNDERFLNETPLWKPL
jgi:protein TonB